MIFWNTRVTFPCGDRANLEQPVKGVPIRLVPER
jgi:hypothetical protein